MMRLIAIEWYKLKTHRFFWIGMGLFLLLLGILLFNFGEISLPGGQKNSEDEAVNFSAMLMPKNFAEAGFYFLPNLWQNATYISGFFKFIPAFLMLFFMSSEFEYRTYRQNVIDGMSIGQFFFSKFLTLLFFTFLSTLVVGISIVALAFMNNDMAHHDLWLQSSFLVGFFMEMFFLLSFALFLGLLLKRSAIAIIVLLMYYYVIEPIAVNAFQIETPYSWFFPTQASRDLILQPFTRMINFFSESDELPQMPWNTWFIALGYSCLFLLSSFGILKKRDL
jgi:ABC-2 type transport system permease protein